MGLLDRIAFRNEAAAAPEAIDVTAAGELKLVWPGGVEATVPPARLRDLCPCAGCVEEGSGRKILDPASIPADIRPLAVHAVGSYAVQIQWSDGHSTGIYTWALLRDACGLQPSARQGSAGAP